MLNKAYFHKSISGIKITLVPYTSAKKGKTVDLNTASLPFYKRIITDYEKSDTGDKMI
jgi:hypothetical protein